MIRHDDDPRKDKNEKEAISDEYSTKQQQQEQQCQRPCFNKNGYVLEDWSLLVQDG